jgi:hypothetical protein
MPTHSPIVDATPLARRRTPARLGGRAAARGQWIAAAAASLFALVVASPAAAGPIGHGPVLLAGYSGDEDVSANPGDLGLVLVGWRWRWDGADCIDNFMGRGGIDFSWSVEPVAGGVFGDRDAFEASLVPLFRLAPLDWNIAPYFEAGIGIAYTTLRNYGLGSRVLFSDNAGIGVTFGSGEGRHWSIGYRYRHLSHAGIFDDQNEGLNAHFLVVAFE